jgi:hypothetical protein
MSQIFSEAREAQIFAAQAIQPKDLLPSIKHLPIHGNARNRKAIKHSRLLRVPPPLSRSSRRVSAKHPASIYPIQLY